MALPLKADITTLDWCKDGLPWCKVGAGMDMGLLSLDWHKAGEPWAANPGPFTQYLAALGNIASAEAFGTPWIFLIPKTVSMTLDLRRILVRSQIRRLKVTSDG